MAIKHGVIHVIIRSGARPWWKTVFVEYELGGVTFGRKWRSKCLVAEFSECTFRFANFAIWHVAPPLFLFMEKPGRLNAVCVFLRDGVSA